MAFWKIKTGHVTGARGVLEYVGELGHLFYSQDDNIIRISDGHTAGGIPLSGGSMTFSGDTPPANPSEGVLWWNTVDGRLYIYYDANWVDASPDVQGSVTEIIAGSGISINTSTGAVTITATVGPDNDSAYVTTATVRTLIANSLSNYIPVTDRITSTNTTYSAVISNTGTITVPGDIMPTVDAVQSLGSPEYRWKSIHIGPGTLYITDKTLGTNAELTVDNGVLQINGANQLQVGQLKFVDNRIESRTGDIDIQIGLTTSTAKLVLNRNTSIAPGKTLTVGGNSSDVDNIVISSSTYTSQVIISEYGNTDVAQLLLHRHSTDNGPMLLTARSNSDTEEDVDVAYGQQLFQIIATGYTGTDYKPFSGISFSSEDNNLLYTLSDTSSPGRIDFNVTPDGQTGFNTPMSLRCDGTLRFENGMILNSGVIPSSSIGSPGDLGGMFIVDNNYIYHCSADYDGVTDIWKRTAQTGGAW